MAVDIVVKGKLQDSKVIPLSEIRYIAASPAVYNGAWSGSGMPHENRESAFYKTPNKGTVRLDNLNNFEIKLLLPGSYMQNLTIIPPIIHLFYDCLDNKTRLLSYQVSHGIPYKSLMYPKERKDASFYNSQFDIEVKDQYKILLDSSYPLINRKWDGEDYWQKRPPL